MKKVLIFLTGILISLSSLAQHGNFTDIRIINGDSVLSGTSNGTIFYNRVSNKFRFRQNGSWISIPTGSGGITGSLTSGRVPYASGSSTLNTSPGFEFNPSIYLFTAAENLSFPATLPDHTFISGESHTIIRTSRGSEDAAVFGIGNTVGKTATAFAGNGSFTFGTGNINEGLYSYVGGSNAKVDGQGGFSHALSTGVGIGNPLVYASNGSVNISRNTTSQTNGHGALGVASGIFAGTNGHVSGINSVVLGGYFLSVTDSATVGMPYAQLLYTPINNDTIVHLLARDNSTGTVKTVKTSSLLGGITASNGLTKVGSDIQLGGSVSTTDTVYVEAANQVSANGWVSFGSKFSTHPSIASFSVAAGVPSVSGSGTTVDIDASGMTIGWGSDFVTQPSLLQVNSGGIYTQGPGLIFAGDDGAGNTSSLNVDGATLNMSNNDGTNELQIGGTPTGLNIQSTTSNGAFTNFSFASTSNSSTWANNVASTSKTAIVQNSSGIAIQTATTGSLTQRMLFDLTGKIKIGTSTPTATLHLPAGSTSASGAPLKLTTGGPLTTIESGALEFQGTSWYASANNNRYALGGAVADFSTDANNSGTGETDLYSYTSRAATLNTGDKLSAKYSGTFSDATATVQLKVLFAGNTIGDTGALTISATGSWSVDVLIVATGSSTARSSVTIFTPTGTPVVYVKETDLTSLSLIGSTNILKITGTAGGGGGGSNDITAKLGTVLFHGLAKN